MNSTRQGNQEATETEHRQTGQTTGDTIGNQTQMHCWQDMETRQGQTGQDTLSTK